MRPFLLTLLLLAAIPFLSRASEDYKYLDASGNEILLPKDIPIYAVKNPGPMKDWADAHRIQLDARVRKQGLEWVRIITIRLKHPVTEKEGRIEKIFMMDKDGLIVGYQAFKTEADVMDTVEMRINGVINYIQVYVLCTKHGLWRSEFRLA